MVPFPQEHHCLNVSCLREEGCMHTGAHEPMPCVCGGSRAARRKHKREQSVRASPGLRMS